MMYFILPTTDFSLSRLGRHLRLDSVDPLALGDRAPHHPQGHLEPQSEVCLPPLMLIGHGVTVK
jgi:hypothetical protein